MNIIYLKKEEYEKMLEKVSKEHEPYTYKDSALQSKGSKGFVYKDKLYICL